MRTALQCEALSKRYGNTVALDRLDLDVREGEVVGLLGPNGAGKTTTLRLVLNLIRPTSGRVWIFGHPAPAAGTLAQVGALVEEPAFYPWLNGRVNLEVILGAGGRPPADAVETAMELVDIAHAAHRPVKTYSLGMRQRLALALALARRPRLLILDEPTNGLDQLGIQRLREILLRLKADGTAILFATHTLTEVEQTCDRAAVLRRGRLVAFDDVADLGAADRVLRVTVDDSKVDDALRVLKAFKAERSGPATITLRSGAGRDINRLLVQHGIFAHDITLESAGLESRFLSLLKRDGYARDTL